MLTYRLALAASIAALPGLALAAPPPLTVGSGNVAVIEPPVPVPNNVTVAGIPARVVGEAGCPEPSRAMDQMLYGIMLDG